MTLKILEGWRALRTPLSLFDFQLKKEFGNMLLKRGEAEGSSSSSIVKFQRQVELEMKSNSFGAGRWEFKVAFE